MRTLCVATAWCEAQAKHGDRFSLGGCMWASQVEYIRRDMEGTDTDTRRRTAAELVQTLVNVFPAEVRVHSF